MIVSIFKNIMNETPNIVDPNQNFLKKQKYKKKIKKTNNSLTRLSVAMFLYHGRY